MEIASRERDYNGELASELARNIRKVSGSRGGEWFVTSLVNVNIVYREPVGDKYNK